VSGRSFEARPKPARVEARRSGYDIVAAMENPGAATGDKSGGPRAQARGRRVPTPRRAVVAAGAIVAAAAIAVAVWLVFGRGTATRAPAQHPAAASAQHLARVARRIGHPIYWIGPRAGYVYELSRTNDGRVYIRYLPSGVHVGSRSPNYLTVGTYPQRHAFATLQATAKAQGVQTTRVAGGGLAFPYKGRPTSVYLAYPGSDYQIEVFDPSPARALQLVSSVTAVVAPTSRPASTAASVQQLKALAVSLGHPVYWAGSKSGVTYELTRTTDERVYVRYLPAGVAIGDTRPNYLTVGTYPQKGALAILKATATRTHVAPLKLAKGGLALVDAKRPTSVYVAYPTVDLQIEVFDPSPGRARELVTSGRVTPVP
jgi:hypothetical protein